MSAKEMFEKLDFKFEEQTDTYIAYGNRGSFEDCFVCFELNWKYIKCFYNKKYENSDSFPLEVTNELLQAINKQIEELGWNK